jgi:uncharacterized protein YndB with AHSA1/START domain
MSEFKLSATKRGDTEIVLERAFRAKRELVFKCFTEPELVKQWLGCGCGKTTVCESSTSVGGPWRHVMDMGERGQFETFGQILEFDGPNRLVRSYVYNVPVIREAISTETATFAEVDGVTTVQILVRHLSKENRDGHFDSGLEGGASMSYDALELLIRCLAD